MARTYKRDSRGRFASGGGGGGRPAARGVSRGTNRLTRDNAGRITSVGGNGATARGGRLRTASGKKRATQTAKVSGGRAAGTVTRSGARRTAAAAAAAKPVRRPNTSGAAFEARRSRTTPQAAESRRMQAEMARPIQFSRFKRGGKADREFNESVMNASANRQDTSRYTAQRAKRFHDAASQMHSAFSQRPRYSTVRNPAPLSANLDRLTRSDTSAWKNSLGKRKRRR